MKSFAAALFATAFLAGDAEASNAKTWTGSAVVAAAKTMTPSAMTDYSIDSKSEMTVTYKSMATLATGTLEKKEAQQVWWCAEDMGEDFKTHCNLWHFEPGEADNQTFKAKVYY